MKFRSIASAAALVCLAAPAFALTPAQIDGSTVQLWISGATAPTAGVAGAIAKLCADEDGVAGPDDLHTYLEVTPANASDAFPGKSLSGKFAAYACTMGSAAGSLAGVKTVVYHTYDSGSFEAYTPHLFLAGEMNAFVPSSLKRLNNIATAPCVAHPTVANTYTGCGSVLVSLAHNADQFSLPTLPIGGVSDTEYTLNQLNLGIGRSLDEIGSEVSTNVGQGFGVAVSYPLYVAMQNAQGLTNNGACAANGSGAAITAVDTTAACQPNINRQKYASLVSTSVANKNASLLGVAPAALTVERRVGTSGTQSASNAFFLNKPCATGEAGGERNAAGTNTVGTTNFAGSGGFGVAVRSNNGSSNVKTNLTNASSAGTYGIGVLSLENSPSSTEKFAFLKLNGVSPTTDTNQRQTAIDGDYEFWYELVAFTAASAPAEGTDLMTGLATVMADPSVTNLKGLFPTRLSGFSGTTVSKGAKGGNACSVAVQ